MTVEPIVIDTETDKALMDFLLQGGRAPVIPSSAQYRCVGPPGFCSLVRVSSQDQSTQKKHQKRKRLAR